MNPFEMVFAIVLIVTIGGIYRAKYNRRDRGASDADYVESKENVALREEVKALKERLQVLERITVEKENSLTREIEELRDR